MTTFEDYLAALSESDLAEYGRIVDRYLAATAVAPGPERERLMDAVHDAARAIECVLLMAAARMQQMLSLRDRDAHAEMFALFAPTMALAAERGSEIPERQRAALESFPVAALQVLVDDPAVPRATVEEFLDDFARQTRSGGPGYANLALARALWHAHTGERDTFEGWFDRWLTSGSTWWRADAYLSVGLTAMMLGCFDPADALDHLRRRTPTMTGSPDDHHVLGVDIAGWLAACGDPAGAWQQLRAVLAAPDACDLAPLAGRLELRHLLRAAETAPEERTPDGSPVPGRGAIVAVAAAALDPGSAAVVEDSAALARHHVLRGDRDGARRWRERAEERAAAYDRRNGTGHHARLLGERWFHDL